MLRLVTAPRQVTGPFPRKMAKAILIDFIRGVMAMKTTLRGSPSLDLDLAQILNLDLAQTGSGGCQGIGLFRWLYPRPDETGQAYLG